MLAGPEGPAFRSSSRAALLEFVVDAEPDQARREFDGVVRRDGAGADDKIISAIAGGIACCVL